MEPEKKNNFAVSDKGIGYYETDPFIDNEEAPSDCKALIDKLKACNNDELLEELSQIKTWNYGKCELYNWTEVLDKFDHILEVSCGKVKENQWCLPCDGLNWAKHKRLLLYVLQFTALLIEHSFSWHYYNSMEHLTTLLSSSDMNVVLAVLNLLYVFSKRSNFITRLNAEKRQTLLLRLLYLAESWGGTENGFGLADCCQDFPITVYPSSATTVHFEHYAENVDDKAHKKSSSTVIGIHIDKIINKTPSQIMEELVEKYAVPEDKQMQLFTHIRLAHSFSNYPKRMLCVQARLQALSVLVYCNAVPDNVNSLLYNGLIEELVEVLKLQDTTLIEIKAAALRTLTSIIHLDSNPKLSTIIDMTGAALYYGFLPVLVRNCIQALTEPDSEPFPLPFATALFSFLYHLASYESGGDALVSCGMVEALLKVINWHSTETEHITFVTGAVRVIDLITNLDMQAFQAHGGLASFIQRLEMEVNVCRKDQPFVINPKLAPPPAAENPSAGPSRSPSASIDSQAVMEIDSLSPDNSRLVADERPESSIIDNNPQYDNSKQNESKKGLQCFPQRAALLKSMLNFLKKSIQDSVFSDSIRHLMDGTLPQSLKHIISNAEYYGPSLFLLATDVVTVYVFQEPTLLPSLQDNGLTDVVLHALLVKEIPATREVLASLPNVFSALCLNVRGLQSFVAYKPFEKLFRILVSPEYLPAMRRRRSSDLIGDAASNLGNAMDELMRHQPSLSDATAAIIKEFFNLLSELQKSPLDTSSQNDVVAHLNTTIQKKDDMILNLKNELNSFIEKVTQLTEDNRILTEQMLLKEEQAKGHADDVIKELGEELSKTKQEKEKLSNIVSEKDKILLEKEVILLSLDKKLKDKESEISELSSQKAELQQNISKCNNELQEAQKKYDENVSGTVSEYQERLSEKEQELSSLRENHEKLLIINSNKENALLEKEEALKSLQEKLKENETEISNLTTQNSELLKNIAKFSSDIEEIERVHNEKLFDSEAKFDKIVKEKNTVVEEIQNELAQHVEIIESKTKALTERESEVNALKNLIKERDSQFDEISKMAESSQNQLVLLKEQNEKNESLLQSKESFFNDFKADQEKQLQLKEQELSKTKQEKEKLSNIVSEKDKILLEKEVILLSLDKKLKDKESEISELSSQKAELQQNISKCNNELQEAQKKYDENVSGTVSEYQERLSEKEQELSSLRENHEKLLITNSKKENALLEKEEALKSLQDKLKENETEISNLTTQNSELLKNIAKFSSDIEEIERVHNEKLFDSEAKFDKIVKEKNTVVEEIQNELAQHVEIIESKTKALTERESEVNALKNLIKERDSQFDEISKMAESSQNQLVLLKEQNEKNESLLQSKESFFNDFKADQEKQLQLKEQELSKTKQEKEKLSNIVSEKDKILLEKEVILLSLDKKLKDKESEISELSSQKAELQQNISKCNNELQEAQKKYDENVSGTVSEYQERLSEKEQLYQLCADSPMRQRRCQQIPPSPSVPSPAAPDVTNLLTMGLSSVQEMLDVVPNFRMTFYTYSIDFTSPMLFDERKYPYHLMLKKFLSCGDLDAFLNTFQWALTCGNTVKIEKGLENPQLPDAWLMLLEKMVNPKNVLEDSQNTSPPKLIQPGSPGFNPVLYLIPIYKNIMESLMYLWYIKYLVDSGENINESIVAVICDLLKGETIIKEEDEEEDKAEESDEESNSGTSDTDIENQSSDVSPKNSFESYTLESEDSRNEEATSDSKDMKEASSKVPLNEATSDWSITGENAEMVLADFSVQFDAETVSSKDDSSTKSISKKELVLDVVSSKLDESVCTPDKQKKGAFSHSEEKEIEEMRNNLKKMLDSFNSEIDYRKELDDVKRRLDALWKKLREL